MPYAVVYKSKFNWEKTNTVLSPVVVGLRQVGYEVEVREGTEFPRGDERKFDLAFCWGDTHGAISILAAVKSVFPHVGHVDNAYLNRKRYEGHYAITWGGQRQCHEYLWSIPQSPERFAALHEEIKPWRSDGKDILVLAPSVKQGKILGFEVNQWARQVADRLQQHTKRRVIVRIKRYNVDEPLRDILRREPIFAAIGYNTKGLVECLLEGVSVFSLGPCVTERMGKSDLSAINFPLYPHNRLEFFERLANTQWLLSEIAEGLPFQEGLIPT